MKLIYICLILTLINHNCLVRDIGIEANIIKPFDSFLTLEDQLNLAGDIVLYSFDQTIVQTIGINLKLSMDTKTIELSKPDNTHFESLNYLQ
jgi:hypothetical protein